MFNQPSNRNLVRRHCLTALIAFLIFSSVASAQEIVLDASKVLNQYADKVGIWVNTNTAAISSPSLKVAFVFPLIAKWPAGIQQPGRVSDTIISLTDLMATFADVAQRDLVESRSPDTITFASALQNLTVETARQSVVVQGGGNFVIRDK